MTVKYKYRYSPAFTIVELLVVIVVIGILAAITIVSYTGISNRATISSMQSDLTNASTQLKIFNVDNSNYPNTISTDCTAQPDTTTNKCLKSSNGITYSYYVDNTASKQNFCVTATKDNYSYSINNTGTVIPVAYCPVLYLDAGNTASYPGSGTTWTDLSGNGNNGALINGVGFSSSNGGVLSFDGVDDYVSFANNTLELGTGDFTIDLFAYIGDSTYTWQRLFGKKGIGGAEQGYSLYWGGANQKLMWSTANGSAGHEYWTNDAITINNWHHIVMVRNSSDARIGYYYVDGQRNDVTTVPAIDDVTKSTAVPYAGSLGGTSLQFKGSISNIHVYNRALNANEIQQNFNSLRGRYGL